MKWLSGAPDSCSYRDSDNEAMRGVQSKESIKTALLQPYKPHPVRDGWA